MKIINLLGIAYTKLRDWARELYRSGEIYLYIIKGRKPWSKGYFAYKNKFLTQAINDTDLVEKFSTNSTLPKQYGEFLDERVVEYPWFIARVNQGAGRLLDAGSALNYQYLLKHPTVSQKEVYIVTLEPEKNCYWQNRISYLFADIRNLPFLNDWFDEVVSISTIEHIGMDNSIYTSDADYREYEKFDCLKAISELKRITKPGGKVYITVPYGKYTNFGWYQQFNLEMIDMLINTFSPTKVVETYYCYESGGWSIRDKQYCQNFEGFNIHDTKYYNPQSTKDYDPDYAACSRAIAALEMWK